MSRVPYASDQGGESIESLSNEQTQTAGATNVFSGLLTSSPSKRPREREEQNLFSL